MVKRMGSTAPSILAVPVLWIAGCACTEVHAANTANGIRTSDVRDFFPLPPASPLSLLKAYPSFPTVERGLPVSEYPGIVKLFHWYTTRFIRPELLPDCAFVAEHLKLVRHVDAERRELDADIAYLRYRLDTVDVLIAQICGNSGLTHVFLSGTGGPVGSQQTQVKRFVERVIQTYCNPSVSRGLALGLKSIGQITMASGRGPSQSLTVYVRGKHVWLMHGGVSPMGGMPAKSLPFSGWFERSKSAYASFEVGAFRNGDHEAIQRALAELSRRRTHTTGAAWEPLLRSGKLADLVQVERNAPPRYAARAIEAMGRTQEGRTHLAKLLRDTDSRRKKLIVAALDRAGTPDAREILTNYVASTPDADGRALEAVLKGMPEKEINEFCLREAEKLAGKPDAHSQKLIFLFRGFPEKEDPRDVGLLRKVLRKTRNARLRRACLGCLAEWISDPAEVRDDVLRVLLKHLHDSDVIVRLRVARALGLSRDIRYAVHLAPLLRDDDPLLREAAASALCELLGWEKPELRSPKEKLQWLARLRTRLDPVLAALAKLDAAINPEQGND